MFIRALAFRFVIFICAFVAQIFHSDIIMFLRHIYFMHVGIVPRKQRHVVKAESSEGQYGKRKAVRFRCML
jgi:hypothetical protein